MDEEKTDKPEKIKVRFDLDDEIHREGALKEIINKQVEEISRILMTIREKEEAQKRRDAEISQMVKMIVETQNIKNEPKKSCLSFLFGCFR